MVEPQPTQTVEIESNWSQRVDSFDDLNLKEELLRGIYGYGFEKPSVIQQTGILPVLTRKDTIAQAQSGTGKIIFLFTPSFPNTFSNFFLLHP